MPTSPPAFLNPTSFPLRDLLEAAGHLPGDRAVDLQGVRQYGLLRLDEATDSQLGEYSGHMKLSVHSFEETLPNIEPKVTARYRSKGYNGSNSHPKAGLSWPLAYP